MKIEKHLCDKQGCHQERVGDRGVHVYSHSTRDASGNGSEHWVAKADLCSEHLLQFTQRLIGVIEDKRVPNPLKKIFDELQITYELI